jgi:glyoxylase-like metal-dependent hydrolase (beta-lactamase superfamily II)
MLWTNCYVICSDSKDAVVVDPGGPMSVVLAFLKEEGLRVRWILLTHGHSDHILGVDEIRPLASEGVAIHSEDSRCLTSASENLSGMLGCPAVPGAADRLLKDGDILEVGGMSVRVIFTPGHTRGGCCFYFTEGEQELLISGDTLFARSVGRTDLPGGNEAILMESVRKLAKLPARLKVYPGHGPDTTIEEETRLNPYWPR